MIFLSASAKKQFLWHQFWVASSRIWTHTQHCRCIRMWQMLCSHVPLCASCASCPSCYNNAKYWCSRLVNAALHNPYNQWRSESQCSVTLFLFLFERDKTQCTLRLDINRNHQWYWILASLQPLYGWLKNITRRTKCQQYLLLSCYYCFLYYILLSKSQGSEINFLSLVLISFCLLASYLIDTIQCNLLLANQYKIISKIYHYQYPLQYWYRFLYRFQSLMLILLLLIYTQKLIKF